MLLYSFRMYYNRLLRSVVDIVRCLFKRGEKMSVKKDNHRIGKTA